MSWKPKERHYEIEKRHISCSFKRTKYHPLDVNFLKKLKARQLKKEGTKVKEIKDEKKKFNHLVVY